MSLPRQTRRRQVVLGGFVASTRGHSGGDALARLVCTHMGDCSIRSVWRRIQGAIDSVLSALTLKDLLRSEPEMNAWATARDKNLPTYSPHA